MKTFIIKENEAGQRFDKYLKKLLKEAPSSFVYKMLRKKNIVLNGKKADGSEKLNARDEVKLFLADETYDKFAGAEVKESFPTTALDIVYEDEDILAFRDIQPAAPIHILVIPKKHITSLATMEDGDEKIISKIYKVINEIAEKQGFKERRKK